jgi:hypothetical protein
MTSLHEGLRGIEVETCIRDHRMPRVLQQSGSKGFHLFSSCIRYTQNLNSPLQSSFREKGRTTPYDSSYLRSSVLDFAAVT